jgi:hypothetical protein
VKRYAVQFVEYSKFFTILQRRLNDLHHLHVWTPVCRNASDITL